MKKYILTSILFCVALSLFAQNKGSISGIIIDSSNNQPIEFVSVALFNSDTKALIKGSTSNSTGAFSLKELADGNYSLKITFVGYKEYAQNVKISPEKENVRLPKIVLIQDSKMLKEVEVVGQTSQMKLDIDKKVFIVNTGAFAGLGATDVLQNIPSVNVDVDGNISLRNDQNVQVWINGKPSGLTADNRGQILDQLPAESIESVEIITNPSAKYNPDGTAGIINIILKKERKGGYYGNVVAGVSTPHGDNLGTNLNYSNSKIDAYLNVNYKQEKQERGGYAYRNSFANNDTTKLNQTNTETDENKGMFVRAGLDYHIDKTNTIGFSGFSMVGSRNSNILYNYEGFNNNTPLDSYTKNSLTNRNIDGYNLNLDYKHEFPTKGHELTASVAYSKFAFDTNSSYLTNRADTLIQNQISNNTLKQLVAQADYTLPIDDQSKFEAGYKSTISTTDSYLTLSNAENNVLVPNFIDDFVFKQQTHAAYATYKNVFETIGYLVGLRGEETITNWTDHPTDNIGSVPTSNSFSYFDLFPSLFLSKKFNETNELQFSVTRRINRPDPRKINPFKNISDSTNITYGNPDLKPEYALVYELNYIKSWKANTLSSCLYFHQTDDVIQQISSLYQTPIAGQDYLETTYKNISSSENTGLELTSKNRIFTILEVTSVLNAFYARIIGSPEYNVPTTENFSWNAKVIANILLGKGFSGQIIGNYNAPALIAQGKILENHSIDMSLRKSFHNIVNVNLSFRDILNSRKTISEIYSTNFNQKSESYRTGRNLLLTVSYNFGNMKSKNKPKPDNNKDKDNNLPNMNDDM